MKRFDSLTGKAGNTLIGCEVVGEDGKHVGTLSGVWMDPSTQRVEFVGIKTNRIFERTHPVPARSVEVDENGALIKLPYSVPFIEAAPEFDPDSELAEVEKQQVTGYYQCFVPIRRVTAIEEIRPEQSIGQTSGSPSDKSPSGFESAKNRAELERDEQLFFKQEGFVTNAMGEVNVSEELKRTQREAKGRQEKDA